VLESGGPLGRLSAAMKNVSYRPPPSSAGASATMRANRPTGTKPEAGLRSELHRRGFRFRKNLTVAVGGIRTAPDIVFQRQRVAVFVDGCFWHGCPTHATSPRANADYWLPKLARNRERDSQITHELEAAGWRVIRVWEHQDVETAADAVSALLRDSPPATPAG
jgi:DNA mismatch endonuclease, patch repair protein